MSVLSDLLRFINIFAWALHAGSVVFVFLDTIPGMRRLTPVESVRVHQVMLTDLLDRFMPATNLAANVAAILILALDRDLSRLAVGIYLLGLVSGLLVTIPGATVKIPTNRLLGRLGAGVVPDDYAAIRRRWDSIHIVQTLGAVVALACFIIAALVR